MGNRNLEIRLCIFFDRFSLPLRLDVFHATKEEDFFFFFYETNKNSKSNRFYRGL